MRKVEKITKPCVICGTSVTRIPSWMLKQVCCSPECTKKYKSEKMSALNKKLNPDRMNSETRAKLRSAHLNTGEGKTYTKTFSRHTHRIVAEQKLGRALLPGEIVHHEDEDKRNNNPSNLIIFSSQSEHVKYHMNKRKNAKIQAARISKDSL